MMKRKKHVIKDNQETLMIHVAELINYLVGDDAKKGEEKKGEGYSKSKQVKPICEDSSKSKDWFDSSKAVVQDPYLDFAPLSQEEFTRRFKGFGDVKYTEQKFEDRWRKEGGIKKAKWVEPDRYTPYNLPHYSYDANWTNERRYNWILTKMQYTGG